METKPHRARVFKDPDHWPCWQVYYGDVWVGSAHSRVIAHAAAQQVVYLASNVCEQNLTPLRIIAHVARNRAWLNMWRTGMLHMDHVMYQEMTRNMSARVTNGAGGEVRVQWAILAA